MLLTAYFFYYQSFCNRVLLSLFVEVSDIIPDTAFGYKDIDIVNCMECLL